MDMQICFDTNQDGTGKAKLSSASFPIRLYMEWAASMICMAIAAPLPSPKRMSSYKNGFNSICAKATQEPFSADK